MNERIHNDLAERMLRVVNARFPLGPSDAQSISDAEVAGRLFDPHNQSFNELMREDISVVVGRRGSGKTALLRSYLYRDHLPGLGAAARTSDIRDYEVVITVKEWQKFVEMQNFVAGAPGRVMPVEAIIERWQELIHDYLLASLVNQAAHLLRREVLDEILRFLNRDVIEEHERARRAVWGAPLMELVRGRPAAPAERRNGRIDSSGAALALIDQSLRAGRRKAICIFDSLDEYQVKRDQMDRTVGALLRFIARFNAGFQAIRIKLALPAEIFPEIQEASGNPLKDLVDYNQVRWDANELCRIAAYRFRLFLQLHDEEHYRKLTRYDIGTRQGLRGFWQSYFTEPVANRYGLPEHPMTYLLRHTQMLPRQMFYILERIILRSKETRHWRSCETAAIRPSIEEAESNIAREVFGAFRDIYPSAALITETIFGNMPTIFDYDMLEDRWRKYGRALASRLDSELEFTQFGQMLLRMGICGIRRSETERYIIGEFAYHMLVPFRFGPGNEFCMHPIFSKHFNCRENGNGKAVLPVGASFED